MDLKKNIYIVYSTQQHNIFLSSTHGTFSRIDRIGHNANPKKYKKIIPSFSGNSGMKLEINRRKTGKFTNQ